MKLLVIGAGGHAKVVIDAAEKAGHEVAGIVGAAGDPEHVLGHTVSLSAEGIDAEAFIVAIGDNRTRARYFADYSSAGLSPASVIHPSAVISDSAVLGGGTFVAAGVVVNPEARIGDNVILNTSCVVEHDVVVGDHSHLGPNSSLCGACSTGEGVLFGAGSSARPGMSIGSWTVCGTGCVVVSDLPPNAVCLGIPARPVRTDGD